MVEACAGFDADLASAYLENALGVSARSRYDSHLAGCPACRRYVIELSRLINQPQIDSQTLPDLSTVPVKFNLWERMRAAVADWFGGLDYPISKWGWAGAGTVAAIMVGVIFIQLGRQQTPVNSSVAETTVAGNSGKETSQSSEFQQGSAATTNLSEALTSDLAVNTASGVQPLQVPRPQVGPFQTQDRALENLPNLTDEMRTRQMALNSSFSISTATGPAQLKIQQPPLPPQVQSFSGNLAPNAVDRMQSVSFPNRAGAAVPPPSPEMNSVSAERSNESTVAAKINPSPSDNPMVRKGKSTEPQSSGVLGKALSFIPNRFPKNDSKLEETEIDPDAPKLLTVRVRDKVLSYQGGIWVDSTYKPEMAWRLTKLVRDSDEYKQVLAAEPQLKEYFDRGSIIIVWKDKIYKVVNK